MSTEEMAADLSWVHLRLRREKHVVKLVRSCINGQPPSYFSDFRFIFSPIALRLRVDQVNLESTKKALLRGGFPS